MLNFENLSTNGELHNLSDVRAHEAIFLKK